MIVNYKAWTEVVRKKSTITILEGLSCKRFAGFCHLVGQLLKFSEHSLPDDGRAKTVNFMIQQIGLEAIIIGEGGLDWPAVAAGTTLFLLPIVIFTVLLRNQLLRGITFGAVRK